jgi:hypothetical protein
LSLPRQSAQGIVSNTALLNRGGRSWLAGGPGSIIITQTFVAVVYGYDPKSTYPYLSLRFGDVVHILEENGGWYRGFSLHDKHTKGIFPSSHINIKECNLINPG